MRARRCEHITPPRATEQAHAAQLAEPAAVELVERPPKPLRVRAGLNMGEGLMDRADA